MDDRSGKSVDFFTTPNQMNDYINKAPPAQLKTPNGKYMKYHRKADNSLVWDGDDKTWAGKTYFTSEVKPDNANYIKRDRTFAGSFKGAPKNRGANFHNTTQVHQMVYPEDCRKDDRLVEYKNKDYPWIISMARYKQCLVCSCFLLFVFLFLTPNNNNRTIAQ